LIIADVALKRRTPVLVASSSEVYGDGEAHEVMKEDRPARVDAGVRWNYAAAKLATEHLFMSLSRQYGIPVWVARLFNVIGPRQSRTTGAILPSFCYAALRNDPIIIHGDGQQRRTFLHVEDAASALLALISDPLASSLPVNVGGTFNCKVLEFAQIVRNTLGSRSPLQFVPLTSVAHSVSGVTDRNPDLERIHATGWTPKLSVEQAILDCAEFLTTTSGQTQNVAVLGAKFDGASAMRSVGTDASLCAEIGPYRREPLEA
jgi:UDP-glucose 4-epimerase